MTDDQARQRYEETGRHLGKFDTVEQAGAAAEALHQREALQQSQHPQGQQPQITPEMAKALENAFKDEARVPMAPTPAEALPVQPINNLPQGVPGGPQGGRSLAPAGLSTMPTGGGFTPGAPMSQGGSIAMAGMLPAIENSTYSTPLLNTMAQTSPTFGASSLSPIPISTLGGWGWGSGSGFNIGGGGEGAGFSSGMAGFDGGGVGLGGGMGSFGFFGGG